MRSLQLLRGSTTLANHQFDYGTTDINGNLLWQSTATPTHSYTQTYGYDSANRLRMTIGTKDGAMSANLNTAATCGTVQGAYNADQSCHRMAYDEFGNVWNAEPAQGGATVGLNQSSANWYLVNGVVTNRMSGVAYDNAGNQTQYVPGNPNLVAEYDAENHVTRAKNTQFSPNTVLADYYYNGAGQRVKKVASSVTTYFVYGADGQCLAEYQSGGTVVGSTGTQYWFADHLGSARIKVRADGTRSIRNDYEPFGAEISRTDQGFGVPDSGKKFTGKERDAETGLDYFQARYMSSAQGRFTSADAPFADQHPEDPQSWNLYAYGRNNPMRFVDHDGREATVTIETDEKKKTGTITVSASIAVYAAAGSGLSAQQTQAAASAIQTGVNSAWSGTYKKDGITYTVATNVSVQVVANEKAANASGAQNVIGLSNGNAIPGRADSFVSPAGVWASLTGGADTGTWNVQNLGRGVAAHEYTHLMGVGDNSGNVLSNTNLLNNPQIPHSATAADYGLAFGGAIDSHRSGSRSFSLSPFGYSAPQSSRSSTTVRAPSPFGNWR